MPTAALFDAFERARERHADAVAALVPLLVEMSFSLISEALPGAEVLELHGEMNEDWAFRLRVLRVLDGAGRVLYDADAGHDEPVVTDAVDQVAIEYLDLLLDLTGDRYLGGTSIRRSDS